MVPAEVILLDALPLNANGKIARNELPRPRPGAAAEAADQPMTGLEQTLAEVWCETLGLADIGLDANFFELGGNSLSMMRLCSKLRERTGADVPFAEAIGLPTIRQQAAWLAAQGAAPASRTIPRQPPAPDYPLSFSQQRLWFESLLGNGASYNLPVAMRLDGELDAGALALAIEQLVAKHEVLRSRYFSKAGHGRQRIAPMAAGLVEQVDLAGRADPDGVCRQALLDAVAQPFDLEQGPVFRAVLYRLGERAHVLLLNMHHIVADGWSMRVLFDEVTSAYARIVRGEPAMDGDAPALQYTDYACWQRDNEGDSAGEQALAFWTEALAFVPALPLMPTDAPRYAAPSYPLGTLSFAVPAEVTAALKRVAVAHDASLFMVLMAAYGFVIADYSSQDRVLVGTDIAGRDHAESERMVGLFVNQLGIVASVEPGARFADLLAGVRTHTLAAYRNQHVPVEKVVAALQLERGLSQHPLFQTKLVLQNFPASSGGAMPAIERSSIALGTRHCKLDLMLTVSESGGVLQADWEFNADYFREPTIRKLEANLLATLQRVAADAAVGLDVLRADFGRQQRDRLQALRGRLAGATRVRQALPVISTPESEGIES
jgi:aryl carrier-like protein